MKQLFKIIFILIINTVCLNKALAQTSSFDAKSTDLNQINIPPLEVIMDSVINRNAMVRFRKKEIEAKIHLYEGLIIRSRFSIDKAFLDKATNLKFIGRVGAGLENIQCNYAATKNIQLIAAPELNILLFVHHLHLVVTLLVHLRLYALDDLIIGVITWLID